MSDSQRGLYLVVLMAAALSLGSAADTSSNSLSAADFDVYVLTGQSNSLGTSADSAEVDVNPGIVASDTATRFYWSNVSSANAAYPIDALYGDSAESIATLQAQQGDGGANSVFWGPEIGFARAMAGAGHANVMVIKASRGGGGNTFWSETAFQSNPNSGHMYQHVLDTVQAATTQLENAGHTFRIAGLMYLQGESDSAAEASVAGQRFTELLNNLRNDLPNASTMHAVIGGIAASGSTRDLVRTRQSAVALSDPTIDYFTNLDLAGSLYDSLHFNKPAKLEIGRRYARRFLQATGELPLVETTPFAEIAEAPNATKVIFDHYVPDPNGAPPGTNLVHPGVFDGFATGLHGNARMRMIVETSDGSVTFGDRHPLVPSSDLIVGNVDLPAPPPRIVAAGAASSIDGGRSIRITFVDPLDPNRKAAVASVAFELGALVPEDQLIVSFLDVDGNVLDRTGEMSNGSFGFTSYDGLGGAKLSNIHQIVLAGSATAGWTVGHSSSLSVPDFAFQEFRIIPEPSGAGLGVVAMVAMSGVRRRWFRRQGTLVVDGA